jgi:transposase
MPKNKSKLEIKPSKIYSKEFKKQKVEELLKKRITVMQLNRIYGISRTALYNWIYEYSPNHSRGTTLVVQMESESFKTQHLQQQVAELERTIGQKQLEIDFLNKLLQLGGEELGYDLKKNFEAKLLSGIDVNKKNMGIK